MGEVRTQVLIINAVDEALERAGQLAAERVRRYEADAMVDSGAVRSVMPAHVAQQFGVDVRGQRVVEYADGRKEMIDVAGPIIFSIYGRDTTDEALVSGDEVSIGGTVIAKLDLLVDCNRQKLIPQPGAPGSAGDES